MLSKVTSLIIFVCILLSLTACESNKTNGDVNGALQESQNESQLQESMPNTSASQPTHIHSFSDATCTIPKKCLCGESIGEALGHKFSAATCVDPQICSRCGISGEIALGHNYSNATCTAPRKCTRCGIAAGTSLGHQYTSATCTSPMICSRCGSTKGKELGHTYSEANCNTPKTCIHCGQTSGSALGHKYVNKKCSICGKIDPNSYAYLYDMDVFDSDNTERKKGLYDSFGNYYDKSIHMGSATKGWGTAQEGKVTYYLNGKYDTITGKLAYQDYYLDADWHIDYYINIYVYADDDLVYSKEKISKSTEPFEFSANINKCKFLTINVISEGPDFCYLILSDLKVEKK